MKHGPIVAVLLAWLTGIAPAQAEPNDLLAALEKLEQEIEQSRTLGARTEGVLEELRADLFQTALQARDAKGLSDRIAADQEGGLDTGEALSALRTDIVQIGLLLRDLRDRINLMATITTSGQELIDRSSERLATLKKEVSSGGRPSRESRAEIARLEKELAASKVRIADLERKAGRTARAEPRPEPVPPPATTPTPAPASAPSFRGAASLPLAFDALAGGDVDTAEAMFDALLEADPESVDARLGRALCRFERGDLETAEALANQVLAIDETNARALGLLGAVKLREGKVRSARRTLTRAVEGDPANAYNQNYLGVALFESNRREQALTHLQAAVDLDPDYTAAHFNLAVVLSTGETPDLDASRLYYQRALTLGSARSEWLDQVLEMTP